MRNFPTNREELQKLEDSSWPSDLAGSSEIVAHETDNATTSLIKAVLNQTNPTVIDMLSPENNQNHRSFKE